MNVIGCDSSGKKKKPDKETNEWFDEHYGGTSDEIQPIEFMQSQFSEEAFVGAILFNIIKYSSRLGKKDSPLEEARKILRYSQWLVQVLEGETIDPRV